MLTLDDINAFEATLGELEQAFIDSDLADFTTKANDALAAAQAAGTDTEALNKALSDAQKAVNGATKKIETSGYAPDGVAGTYVNDTLAPIVDQIQGMIDEAAAAAPAEEEAPAEAPAEGEAEAPADSSSSSEGGSSTGIIVAIVVAVVVVIAAVVGIVLGKKKK